MGVCRRYTQNISALFKIPKELRVTGQGTLVEPPSTPSPSSVICRGPVMVRPAYVFRDVTMTPSKVIRDRRGSTVGVEADEVLCRG